MYEFILEMKDICKNFPGGVKALQDVSFNVKKGEVHALVGENGAGKSTLMKILDGVYSPDAGEMIIEGEKKVFHNTREAQRGGIGLVFQEFNLVPQLSAIENAFLGRLVSGRFGVVKWKNQQKQFMDILKEINFELNPNVPVSELSIAEKQMVEIIKALLLDAKILVMDEPTATLTDLEIKKLFKIIKELKEKGVTIIYISHRLEEIFQICDRVTIIRDGEVIDTNEIVDTNKIEIIEKMVGRSIDVEFPKRDSKPGDKIFEVKNLFTKDFLNDINFDLRKGEILGIAGLVGSGRTETVRAIFGADKIEKGTFKINGKVVKIISTIDAIRNSIGLVPEDRKDEGLAVEFTITRNVTVTNLKKVSKGIFLNRKKEVEESEALSKKLSIKTPSMAQKVVNLSGGNQQKVVLAKWLFTDADILILDEPTRGIDVGAKYEIYVLMNELIAENKSIIMISSELPEVLAMSDRILVMKDGHLKACVKKDELTPEEIMKIAVG